jgi:hypothetical protein
VLESQIKCRFEADNVGPDLTVGDGIQKGKRVVIYRESTEINLRHLVNNHLIGSARDCGCLVGNDAIGFPVRAVLVVGAGAGTEHRQGQEYSVGTIFHTGSLFESLAIIALLPASLRLTKSLAGVPLNAGLYAPEQQIMRQLAIKRYLCTGDIIMILRFFYLP